MRPGVDLGGQKSRFWPSIRLGNELLRRARPHPVPATTRPQSRESPSWSGPPESETGPYRHCRGRHAGERPPRHRPGQELEFLCLIGHALDKDLSAALDRPVRLANDADCFALSEGTDGGGAGATGVFGVILGTGVGGGIVYGGRLIEGPNAIAGEWGHNPCPGRPSGPTWTSGPVRPASCGRSGCVETYLSGPGLATDHRRATGPVAHGRGYRHRRRSRRARRHRDHGSPYRSPRPRPRRLHQRLRSRRDRAGRRAVAHPASLSATCRSAGASGFSRMPTRPGDAARAADWQGVAHCRASVRGHRVAESAFFGLDPRVHSSALRGMTIHDASGNAADGKRPRYRRQCPRIKSAGIRTGNQHFGAGSASRRSSFALIEKSSYSNRKS